MAAEVEQCLFLVNGGECTKPRVAFSPYCPEHKAVYASIDNQTLLQLAAQNQRKMMYVSEDKKLKANADRELIDEFINILHELEGRGYSRDEALEALARVIQEKGVMDDLFKEMGKDPKWKRFEKIVAGINMLTSEGAEVKFNDHIIGKKTGRKRQVDVSIRFKQAYYDYLAIIECKDYAGRVPVKDVEAFSKKLEDLGADKGVMVSREGFQEGASKTAEADGIELFTLTEVKSDWTKTIKADVLTLPWPTNIEFDYPQFELSELYKEPCPVEYGEVLFYRDQNTPPISLHQLIGNMAKWVVVQDLVLPCVVKAPYEPPLLVQFPKTEFYTPIYSITVTFEPTKLALGHEIDMPPKLEKYIYRDIARGNEHEVSADKLPRVG